MQVMNGYLIQKLSRLLWTTRRVFFKARGYFWEYDYHTGVTIFRPLRVFKVFTYLTFTTVLFISCTYLFNILYRQYETFNVSQKDLIVEDTSDAAGSSLAGDPANITPEIKGGDEIIADKGKDENFSANTTSSSSGSNSSSFSPINTNNGAEPVITDPDEEYQGGDIGAIVDPPNVKPPTSPEPIKPIRIVAVGDIACDPLEQARFNYGSGTLSNCRFKQLGDLIRSRTPNAVFLLGDLQYPYSSTERLRLSYGSYWTDILKLSYTIPGNHDYINYSNPAQKGIESSYFDFFGSNTSEQNKTALSKIDSNGNKKGYYSFNLSSGDTKWHVIGLNTNNLCLNVGCGKSSLQGQWLANNITINSSTKCSIAMAHYPPDNTSSSGTTENAIRAREIGNNLFNYQLANKVDIALYGHAHNYERLKKNNGVRAFIVGLGGKGFTKKPSDTSKVLGEFFYTGKSGILQLDLYKDSYTWSLINEDGNIKDSGSDFCI